MRSRFLLMGLVLATAACSEGPTQPDPVEAFQPPRWQGPATFIRRTTAGPLDDTMSWTGDVTWIKDADPDPAPLVAGTAVYIPLSGEMTVTHSMRLGGVCSAERETKYHLKPGDGFLMVDSKGAYTGYLRGKATFGIKIACTVGSGGLDDDVAAMDLQLKGQVANSRMQDVMPVQNATSSAFSGNWDFRYVLSDGPSR
jgi:hypothetical protein